MPLAFGSRGACHEITIGRGHGEGLCRSQRVGGNAPAFVRGPQSGPELTDDPADENLGQKLFLGAVVGGLVLGLTNTYVSGYVERGSALVTLSALAILVVVLLLRPNGLFSSSVARKV